MSAFKSIVPTLKEKLQTVDLYTILGRVIEVKGNTVLATIKGAEIGEMYRLRQPAGAYVGIVEVVGFSDDAAILLPLGNIDGISTKTLAVPYLKKHHVAVSDQLLGRVVNGLGTLIDLHDKPELTDTTLYPSHVEPPDPLLRKPVNKPFPCGIKAIDAMLTCGEGQRVGIFAAAGVGKSTLLSSLIKNSSADVIVLALIGERGREVQEFIHEHLGDNMKKSVVIVATADQPAMQRVRAAYVATTIAEYFRDQDKKVLLLMDSITRYARALREVGLAAGEPPTRRGYPPSVFARLPKLFERAGQGIKGSITAFYTILVEGDDMNEPVADEVRSLVDGHIILSRKLADKNHYPAIDILKSQSRVMDKIVSQEHSTLSRNVRALTSKYNEIELLVQMGEYRQGADSNADNAVQKNEVINYYLQQNYREKVEFEHSIEQLRAIFSEE